MKYFQFKSFFCFSPSFPAAFAGPKILQSEIEQKLGRKVSYSKIKNALLELPSYSLTLIKHKQKTTRKYMERRAGHTLETDLAFVNPPDGNMIGFILAIGEI